jgi:phage repressor protein C with HTH and peptisase S24 domain
MLPTLRPGQIVVAVGPVTTLEIGDIVVVRHDGRDKIKRVAQLKESQEVYLLGDNPSSSEDSRTFGWLNSRTVKGKVVWPRPRRSSITNWKRMSV